MTLELDQLEHTIGYPNWPVITKVTTAFTWNTLEIKNHKVPLYLGWACVALGVLDAIYGDFTWRNSIGPAAYILIGVANIISARVIKWISQHSSWEERYNHKSRVGHKIMYVLVSIVLLVCLYSVIKF